MSDIDTNVDRALDLTEAVCDEIASPRDLEELDAILLADGQSRQDYLDYYRMHVALRLQLRARRAAENVQQHIRSHTVEPVSNHLDEGTIDTSSPVPLTFGDATYGTVGYFSSSWPVAYLLATVILGIGLLIGTLVHVSQPTQIARPSTLPSPFGRGAGGEGSGSDNSPLPSIVGRITGMVDCRWEKGAGVRGQESSLSTIHYPLSTVSLGDKFALSSGLMEITYDTGAKVILQGPVTYEVESAASGYLSVGKLTAKVEKKATNLPSPFGRGAGGEGVESADSPLSTLHSPLFAVRTPTAIVTDLGTEFAVEVDKQGGTTSHVFRGAVRLQVASADGKAEADGQVLYENRSARVEPADANRITVFEPSVAQVSSFVHELPKRTVKVLNVVDLVAVGDDLPDSGRHERWINPTSGQVSNTKPLPALKVKDYYVGDGKYHRVEAIPFVDGVFIPDGRRGPVQVDSAGHVFAGFPNTANHTSDPIWAHSALRADQLIPTRVKLSGFDYAMPGHGLLYVQSNVAITFDLDVVRRANVGFRVLRFRATAGKCEPKPGANDTGLADFWVLVDGQKRFGRREISSRNGDFSVVISIGEQERFLTLASTDSGNGIAGDWIAFGDPRLDLVSIDPSEDSASRK